MSTATNASQLEAPGDYLAAGIVSVVNADGPRSPFNAFGPRLPQRMPANRVEVRAGGFNRGSDHMSQAPNGTWYYDDKMGTVQVTVVSQRHTKANTGPDAQHAAAIGRCRFLMGRYAQKLLPNAVGGFQIVDVIDQGETYTAGVDYENDRTDLRFAVRVWVPPANYADS